MQLPRKARLSAGFRCSRIGRSGPWSRTTRAFIRVKVRSPKYTAADTKDVTIVASTAQRADPPATLVHTPAIGRLLDDARPDFMRDTHLFADVFDSLPHAVVVVDAAGAVVAHNLAADALFGSPDEQSGCCCCDLVGCASEGCSLRRCCITAAVLERGRPQTLDVSLGMRRVEVTVAPLHAAAGAVLVCRESPQPSSGPATAPPLRITTLGTLGLTCGGEDLGGGWLDHRPGRLLKYLICARGRRVSIEELVHALWPDSGSQGLTSLRQAVHGLRDRLEPGRQKQAPSRFIVARPNAYELNMANVVVDADEFETEAASALRTATRCASAEGSAQLARAAQLYRGEFLPDDPYADWALMERDRLRDLAARVLRALAEHHVEAGELLSATSALQRIADLDPLDVDAQRELMTVMIRQRRHGEAARRYDQFRRRFERAFGDEPDFALSDLVALPERA